MFKELRVVSIHGMEATAFDQVECQRSSPQGVHCLKLSGRVAEEFLLPILDNKGGLVY